MIEEAQIPSSRPQNLVYMASKREGSLLIMSAYSCLETIFCDLISSFLRKNNALRSVVIITFCGGKFHKLVLCKVEEDFLCMSLSDAVPF